MGKQNKIMLSCYLIFSLVIVFSILYMNNQYSDNEILIFDEWRGHSNFKMTSDVDSEKLFDLIADVENYPNVLPQNYISVKIINQTGNTIFAEEEVTEKYLTTKFLIKHTIIPYEKHIMKIKSGDARDTTLTIDFEDMGSSTTLIVESDIHLRGILMPLGIMIQQGTLEERMGQVLVTFTNYAKANP